ncbi:caspase recruitment domain-containing protein 14-like [Notothenia coriiceps]|uniref:Caspase recruitment domain-containing protein 14-like n=1 Tax=Notothenia coriiceps TaxID=8208 RepID=A0A6I9PVC5_9TELE|nr:PREDICTED: caspase recruitment domain-containing protein 14-like [Notothenia coriiceps]
MAGECVPEGPNLGEMGEEELWELINDNRHRISLGVKPGILIPYLRQARVLTEMDEDEIVSCHNLTNRSMRTSHMLDLLRTQGRNGAVALLESLMIHYPPLYTQVTGRKPSTEPSRFSGLIKYSELTEYLVRAVTGMQKELQQARYEASKKSALCASLELEVRQIMEHEEKSRCLQSENQRIRRQLCSLQHEITKMKDEKCDMYVRYTAAIEDKSAVNMRLHDLNIQIYQLQTELLKAQTENAFQKTPQLQEELRSLRCQLLKAEKLDPARQDILAQDLAEAIDSQVELAEQLRCYRHENEQLLSEKRGVMMLSTPQAAGLAVTTVFFHPPAFLFHTSLHRADFRRGRAWLTSQSHGGELDSSMSSSPLSELSVCHSLSPSVTPQSATATHSPHMHLSFLAMMPCPLDPSVWHSCPHLPAQGVRLSRAQYMRMPTPASEPSASSPPGGSQVLGTLSQLCHNSTACCG